MTGWLLEGRWFTIGLEGQITAWSPAAAERFGWPRKEIAGRNFIDALLADGGKAAGAEAVAAALDGGSGDQAGYTGEIEAVDVNGAPMTAAFALVPIQLSVGYEFNDLLQEISSQSGNSASLARLKAKHESVLSLIESALSGKAAEAAQTEEGGRLAGALVVFGAADAAAAAPARPDNVVSIADAAGLDEARSQLDRARGELEEARVEVKNLQGQLDEARREAQRARNEVDVARQEAKDAADALAVSQRETADARRDVDEARRAADEARAAVEAARIRTEEGQREADSLRAELREARDQLRGAMGQADDEAARARREAAEARAEAERYATELEPLRKKLVDVQRELGEARAELEATGAEREQAVALAERRATELERVRGELGSAKAAVEQHAESSEAVEVVDAELAGHESMDPGELQSVDALRQALDEDRFELHAQPVLDLRTNEITQYELLIRMIGENGRLILPQAFLGTARRAGLSHEVDRWVVRRGIRLLSVIPEEISVEVNLSPDAVSDSELAGVIEEELASTLVDPGRLVLEVAGAGAAADMDGTAELAKRIRKLGCRFALDDFRSTFGSFKVMKDLPLDYLKLDGELVGSLAESRTSQLIVKALVEVAQGTGTKTVAVFVTEEDTLALLRQQSVDFAQGYKVGRPQPVAEIWPAAAQAALPPGS